MRKIVALFVVDPATRVPSSRTVPPQQRSWAWPEGAHAAARMRLPEEVVSQVAASFESYMAHDEALRHREALMAERGAKRTEINEELFDVQFSLCEH